MLDNEENSENLPTRLQLFWLHVRLFHRMLWLAAEGLVVTVLVLTGLVQSLCLTGRRDWGIEVEHLKGKRGTHCEVQTRGKVTGSLEVMSITHYFLEKLSTLQTHISAMWWEGISGHHKQLLIEVNVFLYGSHCQYSTKSWKDQINLLHNPDICLWFPVKGF